MLKVEVTSGKKTRNVIGQNPLFDVESRGSTTDCQLDLQAHRIRSTFNIIPLIYYIIIVEFIVGYIFFVYNVTFGQN